MPAITIRDVPDDIATMLRVRAAQAGESSQAYLPDLMRREAETLTIQEAVVRMGDLPLVAGTVDDVLGALDKARSGR